MIKSYLGFQKVNMLLLLTVSVSLLVFSNFPKTVRANIDNCDIKLEFLKNNNVIAPNSTVLRGGTYKLRLTINRIKNPDVDECLPPIEYKINASRRYAIESPNEPNEWEGLPAIASPTILNRGDFTNNIFSVSYALGGAGVNYTYSYSTLVSYTGISTSQVRTKQINVTFTDDPKQVSSPGQTPPINPGGSTNTGGTNTNGNTNKTPGTVPNTNTGANFNIDLDSDVGSFFNPLTARTVPEIIAGLIRILFVLIGIASVVIIIVSGFRMVLANGNEEQLTKAKKAITWAIIGLIVSLMSFSIVAIVQRLIQVGA